jgi:hypothetical protein
MSTFSFPYYLARDNESTLVDVEAHVSPADPDVGIMCSCVDDIRVTDANKMAVQVTDIEYTAIMEMANERLQEGEGHFIEDILP